MVVLEQKCEIREKQVDLGMAKGQFIGELTDSGMVFLGSSWNRWRPTVWVRKGLIMD